MLPGHAALVLEHPGVEPQTLTLHLAQQHRHLYTGSGSTLGLSMPLTVTIPGYRVGFNREDQYRNIYRYFYFQAPLKAPYWAWDPTNHPTSFLFLDEALHTKHPFLPCNEGLLHTYTHMPATNHLHLPLNGVHRHGGQQLAMQHLPKPHSAQQRGTHAGQGLGGWRGGRRGQMGQMAGN